mmetsp:Transcript_25953/g.66110  ORF Transcript_25953/g.66110 Transcript_25953/m.66110 type:complete len:223 (-) Transcript_25953:848-1516(-)
MEQPGLVGSGVQRRPREGPQQELLQLQQPARSRGAGHDHAQLLPGDRVVDLNEVTTLAASGWCAGLGIGCGSSGRSLGHRLLRVHVRERELPSALAHVRLDRLAPREVVPPHALVLHLGDLLHHVRGRHRLSTAVSSVHSAHRAVHEQLHQSAQLAVPGYVRLRQELGATEPTLLQHLRDIPALRHLAHSLVLGHRLFELGHVRRVQATGGHESSLEPLRIL